MANKFELEYCEELVEHMAKGFSYITIGVKLRVSPSTLYNWEDKHPEWKEAKEVGMMVCQYQWEDILIKASKGEIKANGAALIFALKNYFPDQFKDNQHLVSDTGVTIVIDTGVPRALDHIQDAEYSEIENEKSSKKSQRPQTLNLSLENDKGSDIHDAYIPAEGSDIQDLNNFRPLQPENEDFKASNSDNNDDSDLL